MNIRANPDAQSSLHALAEAVRKAEQRATAGMLALELLHEIKNPLEAVGYLTYLTLEEADKPEKVREYMRVAEEQMAQVRLISSQALAFTRTADTTKAFDLVTLAEAALRIHRRAIDAKKIHLVKHLPESLVAEVYTGEILQVISNLVVNALDALPANGTICVRLQKHSDKVHLVVADNGHGIPRHHMDSIFEPFFTTKGDAGTGLGLSVTKRIIDRHNGKIRVRSSVHPEKSGTTFKICIPA